MVTSSCRQDFFHQQSQLVQNIAECCASGVLNHNCTLWCYPNIPKPWTIWNSSPTRPRAYFHCRSISAAKKKHPTTHQFWWEGSLRLNLECSGGRKQPIACQNSVYNSGECSLFLGSVHKNEWTIDPLVQGLGMPQPIAFEQSWLVWRSLHGVGDPCELITPPNFPHCGAASATLAEWHSWAMQKIAEVRHEKNVEDECLSIKCTEKNMRLPDLKEQIFQGTCIIL